MTFQVPYKKKYTIDEYHRMAEVGITGPEDRVELIDGDIIVVSPKSKRQSYIMRNLSSLFSHVGKSYISQFQDPIRLLEHSKPEPDLALLKWRRDNYRDGDPQAKDILLLIEISDSSLAYDRTKKLSLYAQEVFPCTGH